MKIKPNGFIGQLQHRWMLARWLRAARAAKTAELAVLRAQRQQARQLRHPLQELSHIADTRLALPRVGSTTFARPPGTDWSWRPQLWRGADPKGGLAPARNKLMLGQELTVFHDCPFDEISLRQVRNKLDHDLAAFGLVLEVLRFQGGFVSLVLNVPDAICQGLRKQHLIRLSVVLDREHAVNVRARLNVKHGPNTEQVLLGLDDFAKEADLEFDLAYSDLNENRAEKMWIDLIFEDPGMNRITIRDLNLCRYPRAEV